jgi:hypothetical protein
MDLRKIGWGVWSGFSWLRIGTVGGLLWMRWWTFGFWRHGVSYNIFHAMSSKSTNFMQNEEHNCPEPWLEFLQKLLQSLIGWPLSVPELCAGFSQTLCPSNTRTGNRRGLSPATFVATKPFLM